MMSAIVPKSPAAASSLRLPAAASRLRTAVDRGRASGGITIGVIGGSITEGASATAPDRRWANRFASWWGGRFGCRMALVNAGRGATGSLLGAHRARRDLLSHRPDVVICEFAVNDPTDSAAGETYEGLVRQILAEPHAPAVLVLTMVASDGRSAQVVHAAVAEHYGLPVASYRDAVISRLEPGAARWEDFGADDVHPNDAGHALAADVLSATVEESLKSEGRDAPSAALPAPLFGDLFETACLVEPAAIRPRVCSGWDQLPGGPFGSTWRATSPGATSEIETPLCTAVGLVHRQFRGPLGRARVEVDGVAVAELEGWFDATWGERNAATMVARGLSPACHTVKVTVLPDRASSSEGHQFEIRALLCAGGHVRSG